MAVHRIKAKDDTPAKKAEKTHKPTKITKIDPKSDKKAAKLAKKAEKTAEKSKKSTKPSKKPFLLFRPFVALGHYLRDSWREVRQVRWPDRKLSWKMTISVILYVLIFATVIMLLDALFAFLFNKLLGV